MSKELLTIVSDGLDTLYNPVLVQRNTPFMYKNKVTMIGAEMAPCSQCYFHRKCNELCDRITVEGVRNPAFKIIE